MGEAKATPLQPPARRASGWVFAAASVLAALSIDACAPRQSPTTATPPAQPALRVGIAPNYPPLAFKRNGHITGVEAQFAGKLGPVLGMQTVLVETPWQDLIPALREQRSRGSRHRLSRHVERECVFTGRQNRRDSHARCAYGPSAARGHRSELVRHTRSAA